MPPKLRFLFVSCLILLTSTFVLSQTQKLSSAEALQRYRESLSYLQSVSMKMVANVDSNDHELFPQTLDFVFRQDGQNNRAEWIGKQLIYDSDGEIDLQNSAFIKDISDGNMYVGLEGDHLKNTIDARRIILRYNYKERLKQLLENTNYGGPLFGKMFGSNHKSVADLLGESSDLHIHDKNENINGVACFVLEGTSKYGKVTAWIAPEKEYSAMKWVIEKDPHHLFDDAVISTKWPNIEDWKITFDVKELHEVIDEDNTEFVPKLAHTNFTINFHDGTKNVDHFEWKTSDIQLKPDFEALGAFKIDFPNGIRVFIKDSPSVRYKWENGKPVTFVDQSFLDVLDNEIEQIKSEVKAEPTTATEKKIEVPPDEPVTPLDKAPEAPPDVADTQREVLSESRAFPALLVILIGLLIIGVIVWLVFRRLKA